MKETITLFPAPSFAHMLSIVELGKLILNHHPNLTLKILVATMPSDTSTVSYINRISQTNLPISFFTLPSISLPHHPKSQNPTGTAFEFMRRNVPNVVQALQTMSLTSNILAFITSAILIYDHHIPTYYYFTSNTSVLATFLYLPTIHNQTTKSFKDMAATLLHFPGLPPIPASHMPQPILDRDDQAYHAFLNFAKCLPNCRGIITNTFRALESSAIKAITDGVCVTDGSTPPLYCIGPLIVDAKDRALSASEECISWLNGQPRGSVVFLCFGSRGAFSAEQLKEIAIGLERSDQRFLWVVRNPPPNTNTDPDLEVLLPQGFLERTRNRGLVVKSWAPQGDVLRHDSVGGFVTHCGWNSVVEAVSAGVPMMAWPLYAEQHLNSVVLIEEMKLAIPMIDHTSSSLPGLVIADVVCKRMRELMVEGKSVKDRSIEMKGAAVAAWTDGGSSLTDFSEMVASWK